MENFMQTLFNTNHEMPSGWVLVFLIVISIVIPQIMRWIQNSRSSHNQPPLPPSTEKNKKNSGKKKK